jgi:hypothetical protein
MPSIFRRRSRFPIGGISRSAMARPAMCVYRILMPVEQSRSPVGEVLGRLRERALRAAEFPDLPSPS